MASTTPPLEQPDDTPAYEEALRARVGEEQLERIRKGIADGPAYGDVRAALKLGDPAPPFTLPDPTGTPFVLYELLARGPVVAVFYRGGWCPFCNLQLRAYQLARLRLRALGATVVLISPQRAALAQSLAERQALQFPLLVDEGNRVAREYGLAFQLDADQRASQLAQGVDLAEVNGDERWELPMPATFVIDRAKIVRYAFVSADFTQRAEPTEVIATLHALAQRA